MPRGKIAPDLGLPIALDRATQTPLHQQLCEQLRRAILGGRRIIKTKLPSTRHWRRLLASRARSRVPPMTNSLPKGIWRGFKDQEPTSEEIFPRFHV